MYDKLMFRDRSTAMVDGGSSSGGVDGGGRISRRAEENRSSDGSGDARVDVGDVRIGDGGESARRRLLIDKTRTDINVQKLLNDMKLRRQNKVSNCSIHYPQYCHHHDHHQDHRHHHHIIIYHHHHLSSSSSSSS